MRRLALLCLATCAPDLAPAAAPERGPRAPVPEDSPPHAAAPAPPVPEASLAPLRLLHPNVRSYAPLADGSLLVTPGPTWVEQGGDFVPEGDTSLQRLDAATGAMTP